MENRIRAGFLSALAFLLLTSAAALWSATRSIKTFRAVEHTDYVLQQLSEALAGMVDVETGARGFALAGADEFLQPFNDGQARAATAVENLREATADNPVQQRHVKDLQPLITRRIAIAKEVVDARRASGFAAAEEETGKGRGKVAMDAIRQVISEMRAVERRLLAERSAEAQVTFHSTIWIVSASGALALVIVGVAGIILQRDFAIRQAAEAQRDRFFTLSRDLLCFAGFDGFFKNLNPAWETTLGFTRAELMAVPFIEFVHPDDIARTRAEGENLANGKEVVHFENRYRTRHGSYRWLSWNARASLRQQTIYATARDVTEEKQAAEEISRLNAEVQARATLLEEANRELEAFSYSVSHDLRAPLRHIDGFVDRLNKTAGPQLDDKSKRFLGIIAQSARHMGRLIDDLLIFSRMGRTDMRETELDLEDMVKDVIASVADDIKDRKVFFKYENLPRVSADPAMLRQVFVNLIGNAVKYTRTREQAEIEIRASDTPTEFTICVRDNGVGFDMEYAHKLFGVFQRLHRADEFEGTGIGLANVRRIIHRHGGRTWAEGKLDQGATICFSLPKRKESYEPTEAHIAG